MVQYTPDLFINSWFDIADRDFIARHTLRVEFGLANEMDQLDRNYKLRQVMGTDANCIPQTNHRPSISSPFKQSKKGFA